jgi:GT2 family glycosyltransferase
VVLVDNGSAAADVAVIREHCPEVEIVALAANHGFGRAVNLGAAAALRLGAEHLLLFNNDATLPPNEPVIERLVARLESDPALGAVGPIILDDDGATVQAAGIAFRSFFPAPRGLGKGLPYAVARGRDVRFEFLQGSCLLVRGSAFAAVGGLDADFFFFLEDADLCVRLRQAGYRAELVRDAYVRHRRSSTIVPGSDNDVYLSLRSTLIYLRKHARWYELPTAALTLVGLSLVHAAWRGLARPPLGAIVRAWADFFTGRWGGFRGTWPPGYTPPDLRVSSATADTPDPSRI